MRLAVTSSSSSVSSLLMGTLGNTKGEALSLSLRAKRSNLPPRRALTRRAPSPVWSAQDGQHASHPAQRRADQALLRRGPLARRHDLLARTQPRAPRATETRAA